VRHQPTDQQFWNVSKGTSDYNKKITASQEATKSAWRLEMIVDEVSRAFKSLEKRPHHLSGGSQNT
jgi:hypothetical protein